jgi:hypothetical protein
VLRLGNLALIEHRGERFGLTALGKERYQRFHGTTGDGPDKATDGGLGHLPQTPGTDARK